MALLGSDVLLIEQSRHKKKNWPKTINLTTRFWGKTREPRAEFYCLRLNFNISILCYFLHPTWQIYFYDLYWVKSLLAILDLIKLKYANHLRVLLSSLLSILTPALCLGLSLLITRCSPYTVSSCAVNLLHFQFCFPSLPFSYDHLTLSCNFSVFFPPAIFLSEY